MINKRVSPKCAGWLTLTMTFCLLNVLVNAQQVKHKIAIFTPLYLDSAFDEQNNYRYGAQFPKFFNPGLEFYEGAQLALDSLSAEHVPLEISVYDTRSSRESLAKDLEATAGDGTELILAYTNPEECWNISNTARAKKIPFINVNLPNDAGIAGNPYFVMLNSTLQTHIERIYHYIQKNYALDPIIMFHRKGTTNDVVQTYFNSAEKNTGGVPLKIKYVDLPDSFTAAELAAKLDSNHHSVCIAGNLDEEFGRRLCVQLASITRSYRITLVGMPTFDNLTRDFPGPQYKGLEIVYTTPFYNPRTDKVSQSIVDTFNAKMYARPSDMVMRGYEAVWHFTKLLMKYGTDIATSVGRKEFNVFRELDIQPVLNKQTRATEYFENKKLFFVKWQDGIIKGVN